MDFEVHNGDMPLIISKQIAKKLQDKHGVTEREIECCFLNRTGKFLQDSREEHQTNPPTLWFLAYTNQNRLLKIMFVQENGDIYIKSAYEPSDKVIEIYRKYG